MPLVSFSAGTTIKSADVNANFALCVLTDTSRTVTVTHTFNVTQTFTGGWTAGAACTVSTGGLTITAGGLTVSASGITVTGNSTITGTLTALTGITSSGTAALGTVTASATVTAATGLTVSAGGATVTGNSTVTGTLNTTGATTVATSSGVLNVGNNITTSSANGDVIMGHGKWLRAVNAGGTNTGGILATSAGVVYIGDIDTQFANGVVVRAGGVDKLTFTNTGLATFASGVTLASTLTFSAAVGKIIPGATSISHRNNSDSFDNLLITDAGAVTVRAGLTVGSGLTISAGSIVSTGALSLVSGSSQVVGARITGYTAMTGSADKATSYATSTVTLAQLAGRVMQLQADLTTHGLIGP